MTRPRHKNTSDKIEREMKSKPNQINTLKKKSIETSCGITKSQSKNTFLSRSASSSFDFSVAFILL